MIFKNHIYAYVYLDVKFSVRTNLALAYVEISSFLEEALAQ